MTGEGHAFLSVFLLLLADGLYNRYFSPRGLGSLETPWWVVCVLSSPLLFSASSPPQRTAALIASLYATRFVMELLYAARSHWLVAVANSTHGGSYDELPRAIMEPGGPPLLSGFDAPNVKHVPHNKLRSIGLWPPRIRFFKAVLARGE